MSWTFGIVTDRANKALKSLVVGCSAVPFLFEIVGHDVVDAADVLEVADDFRPQLVEAWGFGGFLEDVVFEMLLFADETPDILSA